MESDKPITHSDWGRSGSPPGLVRERLTNRFADPAAYRVGLVVAPAGSGKSRLLAHCAHLHPGPVAWCGSPDPVLRSASSLVAWIWAAARPVVGAGKADPGQTAELLDALVGEGPPLLIVADDLHLLEGSDAEAALGQLVEGCPERVRLLLSSRVNLDLNLSRLRVAGWLVEIGPEDLRFRTWEVEQLFRDVYRDPLLPEDVALLARRTAGWAAYLQLFHLASARKPLGERRLLLGSLAKSPRLVEDYLSRHVLGSLPEELRRFLVRTSVLIQPSAALCDELLGWESGSAGHLAELERRHLFTERAHAASDHYRYHVVLLGYLHARLVDELGDEGARALHRKAGLLLEREGFTEDALAAFARAEDWAGVARMLGHPESEATLGNVWLDALPSNVVESDATLLLVRARRQLASGDLSGALRTMREAEAKAPSEAMAERCRQGRLAWSTWASPDPVDRSDWIGVIRSATQRNPKAALLRAAQLPGVTGRFAQGIAAWLAGDSEFAARTLSGVSSDPDAPPALAAGARLVSWLVLVSSRQPVRPESVEKLREDIDRAGIPWLTRQAQALLIAARREPLNLLEELLEACQRQGDAWGEAFITLTWAAARLRDGDPSPRLFERAADLFSQLGAGVLEVVARSYSALAAALQGNGEQATVVAAQARNLAWWLEAPSLGGVASLALAVATNDPEEMERARMALGSARLWEWHDFAHTALANPPDGASEPAPGAAPEAKSDPPVRLRCLGRFSLEIAGQSVDESAVKPMERALLHLVASQAGETIHREVLLEALWPEAAPDVGLHRLQVAISSLRRMIGAAGGDPNLLTREGNGYRIALPPESDVDLWQLQSGLKEASSARARQDDEAEMKALTGVVDLYRGPLLPGDGPAEWVVAHRARLQSEVAHAAHRLARMRLDAGDPGGASEAASFGLTVDRYHDGLWQALIESAERSGRPAEAGQARRAYEAVLEELSQPG